MARPNQELTAGYSFFASRAYCWVFLTDKCQINGHQLKAACRDKNKMFHMKIEFLIVSDLTSEVTYDMTNDRKCLVEI
ncbi:unnamed protein product [Calypogeia fissa]